MTVWSWVERASWLVAALTFPIGLNEVSGQRAWNKHVGGLSLAANQRLRHRRELRKRRLQILNDLGRNHLRRRQVVGVLQ